MDWKKLSAGIKKQIAVPENVFALALGIAGISTLCTVLLLTDIYRDTAHVYAVFAREIGQGNYFDGIATKVPMLNISLAGLLARCGMEAVKALSLIGGSFYLATCFPLRKLLERYVSPLMAAWGCVLYVTAPKMIRFACAPLIDSASIFFLVTAALFFLRTAEDPKWRNAGILGLSAGFLAASRGEGFITATVLLLGLPVFAALFRQQTSWKKLSVMWILAIFCALAAVSPFCAMNYQKSGYFVTDARCVGYVKSFGKAFGLIPVEPEQKKQLFMSEDNGNNSWPAKFGHLFSCMMRAGYELYWIFAVIGLIVVIRRKALKSDYLLLLGITLLHYAVYLFVVSATRYYLFIVPFYMVFTLTGIDFLRQKFVPAVPEKLRFLLPVICGVILLLQVGGGLKRTFSSVGKDQQAAGKWIEEYGKNNIPDRELVIFAPGMTETAYWSKARHTDGYEKEQHDPATFREFDLAVVHRKKSFGMEKRKDLERIPDTPYAEDIWIFKPVKQENK